MKKILIDFNFFNDEKQILNNELFQKNWSLPKESNNAKFTHTNSLL